MENFVKNLKITVGQRFQSVRKALKKSQKDIALMLNMKASSIGSIESGKAFPSIPIMIFLYENFGVNPIWIMTGEGKMFNDVHEIPGLKKFNKETIFNINEVLRELFLNIGSNKEHSVQLNDLPLILEIIKALSNRFIMLTISKELIFAEQEFKEFKSKQSSGLAVQS